MPTKNIPALDLTLPPIDRHLVAEPRRITSATPSPTAASRRAPSRAAPQRVVADSDEHDESGKLTEDIAMHLLQQDKRMRKGALMAREALAPEYYGPAGAEHSAGRLGLQLRRRAAKRWMR